jgi:regulator of protease activity HflC (stomatin/prohibitin superfamily)
MNGWLAVVVFGVLVVGAGLVAFQALMLQRGAMTVFSALVFALALLVLAKGLFTIEPNQAVILLLFGKYKGTEHTTGFRWTNPFYQRKKISLRRRNFDSEILKVNDKKGNPIEISAVVVWQVKDTAQAVFDVANYDDYVHVQAESAIRHITTSFPYDAGKEGELSLRTSVDEVSEGLRQEIQERVKAAGIQVIEARINHLAYAPEIASAMLQRQQAEAILAARRQIVMGAVSMVEMTLKHLEGKNIIRLDEASKGRMVSNLMMVLCSDKSAQPVVDAGH